MSGRGHPGKGARSPGRAQGRGCAAPQIRRCSIPILQPGSAAIRTDTGTRLHGGHWRPRRRPPPPALRPTVRHGLGLLPTGPALHWALPAPPAACTPPSSPCFRPAGTAGATSALPRSRPQGEASWTREASNGQAEPRPPHGGPHLHPVPKKSADLLEPWKGRPSFPSLPALPRLLACSVGPPQATGNSPPPALSSSPSQGQPPLVPSSGRTTAQVPEAACSGLRAPWRKRSVIEGQGAQRPHWTRMDGCLLKLGQTTASK